jgi:hypothetical protein
MPYYLGSWYSQLPPFGWFDREDRPRSNALGVPDWQQGIALPSRSTLGQWFNVTPPGATIPYPFQQTDVGPAKWTGRDTDISAAAAHQMGYTPQTFPTNAQFKIEPRDEPRGLGSPAGLPVQAGDLPDNAVPGDAPDAYAGPARGRRTMPDSPGLFDQMFRPGGGYYGVGGQQDPNLNLGSALAQRQNSLIGLGLGLMAGSRQDPYGRALSGYQQGAGLDTETLARNQSLAERRAERAQAQQNWEKTFARGGITDAQKAADDLGLRRGSPEHIEFMKQFYLPKTEQPSIVWQEDAGGNKVPYRQDPRTGTVTPIALPGTQTTPANPFSTGGKMSPDEGKVALFADRAATAHEQITKYENLNQQPGATVGAAIEQTLPAGAANVLVSGERALNMNAKRAFVNALLRRESGMAISAGEYASYDKEYFPQYGDTQEQIDFKRKHRAEVIAGLARESGKGYRPNYAFDEQGNIRRTGGSTYSRDSKDDATRAGPTTSVETKTIGGKTYSKRNGQWYED